MPGSDKEIVPVRSLSGRLKRCTRCGREGDTAGAIDHVDGCPVGEADDE